MQTVIEKLNGANPMGLMRRQLESSSYHQDICRRYVEIVCGTENSSLRSHVTNETLDAEEQV